MRNINGINPEYINEGEDNWDYCNPTVLCNLFGEDVKLIAQEVIPNILRVVMQFNSNNE